MNQLETIIFIYFTLSLVVFITIAILSAMGYRIFKGKTLPEEVQEDVKEDKTEGGGK